MIDCQVNNRVSSSHNLSASHYIEVYDCRLFPLRSQKLGIVGNVLNNKNGGNAPQGLPNLNKAVKSYISQVSFNGVSVASTISSDFAKIVADAQKVVDVAFPPQTATTTAAASSSKTPSQAQKDLKKAVVCVHLIHWTWRVLIASSS